MKYVKFIFENQSVQQTILEQEELVDYASQVVINYNLQLESYIYENLELYISEDLTETFNSIRNFVIQENLNVYNYVSEVLSSTDLTTEDKYLLLETNLLTGIQHALGHDSAAVSKSVLKEAGKSFKELVKSGNVTGTPENFHKHVRAQLKKVADGSRKSRPKFSKAVNYVTKEIGKVKKQDVVRAEKRQARAAQKEMTKPPSSTGLKSSDTATERENQLRSSLAQKEKELADSNTARDIAFDVAKTRKSEVDAANMNTVSAKDQANKESIRAAAAEKSAKNWRMGTGAAVGGMIGSNAAHDQIERQQANELQKSKQQTANLASEMAKNKRIAGVGKFGLYKHQD